MLNCKCLLCAVTSFLFPTAKIGIFVISSLQKAIFFALKYAKTFTFLVDTNKKRLRKRLVFLIMYFCIDFQYKI